MAYTFDADRELGSPRIDLNSGRMGEEMGLGEATQELPSRVLGRDSSPLPFPDNVDTRQTDRSRSTPLTKPIVMPEAYSGQGNYRDWFTHFEACRAINAWTDDQACHFLAVKLKGTALRVYTDCQHGIGQTIMLLQRP